MSKKSLAPVGPTLELHPLTVEILAEINPLALLVGVKLAAGVEPGYIGFMAGPTRGFTFVRFSSAAQAREWFIEQYGAPKP